MIVDIHNHQRILINADLGEGMGQDESIMPYIDMASVACGGHSGDRESMQETVKLAADHKVIIGAHPSYQDRAKFGRTSLAGQLSVEDIVARCLEQIETLTDVCSQNDTHVQYIKPHGALYHDLCRSDKLSERFVSEIGVLFESSGMIKNSAVSFVGLPNSAFEKASLRHTRPFFAEAFADRRYRKDGQLVPRSNSDSPSTASPVLSDVEDVLSQTQNLSRGFVISDTGDKISVDAKTICVHGDTENAIAMTKRISAFIRKNHSLQQ